VAFASKTWCVGLRHPCTTLLLLTGENPKVVSEGLGHASITLTRDRFSHVLPSMQEASAEKLEAMFAGGREGRRFRQRKAAGFPLTIRTFFGSGSIVSYALPYQESAPLSRTPNPPAMQTQSIPVIDLFAGAGGFGEAAKAAGATLNLSVEIDELCCETLERNNGLPSHRVEQSDVRLLAGKDLRALAGLQATSPLVVVGGPPCQPFSKASYWTDPGEDARYRRARARGDEAPKPSPITNARPDERRDLLGEFLRLVAESQADGFVMENVSSLLHPRNREMFRGLVDEFEKTGYKVTVCHANAANYGVPQKRRRIFVMGSKYAAPRVPKKTHRVTKKDPESLPEAEAVAPFLEPFAGPEFAERGEEVEGRWADQLREVPPGSNYKHLTEWAGHPDPVFEAETRFWNFLLKLHPDLPSWTINANPGPWVGPFHWSSRRLRTPELAALQTFPEGYEFCGSRRERVRQIGNAVPQRLAAPMIESVLSTVPVGDSK